MKEKWLYFAWGAESIIAAWIWFVPFARLGGVTWSQLWTMPYFMNWSVIITMIISCLICMAIAIKTKDLKISNLIKNHG